MGSPNIHNYIIAQPDLLPPVNLNGTTSLPPEELLEFEDGMMEYEFPQAPMFVDEEILRMRNERQEYCVGATPAFGLYEQEPETVKEKINAEEPPNMTEDFEPLDFLEAIEVLSTNSSNNENFDPARYRQALYSITTENVLYEKIYLRANKRGVDGYNSDLKYLTGLLFQKAKELGVDTSDIEFKTYNKKDVEVIKEGRKKFYYDGSVIQENQDLLDSLYERLDDAALAQKNAQVKELLVYKGRDLLKEAAEFKYAELNGQTKPKNAIDIDFGNGKIDKVSDQETGNCWVHAPLISIASTTDGNIMMETHRYRDENLGVTAIHLKEAEGRGKGYKGQGIFMITDKEIAEAQEKVSSGDGDVVAYNLAIQKYLIETEGRTDLNGGWPDIIFEIITGMERDMQSMSVNGISSNIQTLYEDVLSMAKNGTGATTISIDRTGESNYLGYSRGGGHALSIVGATDDGNLLVQESNNDGLYISDLPKYSGKTFNGAPTYVMDKETYYNKVLRTDHFYWGA